MTNTIICGDIHGELKQLVYDITDKHNISDSSVIIAGDFGVGFGAPNSMNVQYESVEKKLKKNNNKIYVVRGNHDDPSWFNGDKGYDNLIFLKDYEVVDINGFSVLPIGGAISTDKDWRIKENEKEARHGSNPKKFWWPDEDVTRLSDLSELPKKVDIVVSHEAPLAFDPVIVRPDDMDLETYKGILDSRNYLNKIQEAIVARWWFFGHYHKSYSGSIGDLMYRCLCPLEIYQVVPDLT